MADVTLYFAPFPGPNAIGLQVEEGPTEAGAWTQILDTDEIGTFPNWVSSYVVQAASISNWFRLRWQLVGTNVFTEWSTPVKGDALPFHWTVPDLYKTVTKHNLVGWTPVQIQMLIDRAYYLLQGECGPYDEAMVIDGVAFTDIAQLVIHSVMDQMFVLMSPGFLAGMESERMGSYEYRRKADSALQLAAGALQVPGDLKALLCPYGAGPQADVFISTTDVFLQTEWYRTGSEGAERVYTARDHHVLAPGSLSPWPWWNGFVAGVGAVQP